MFRPFGFWLRLGSLALLGALGAHAQKLVIKGSDTLGAKLVPIWAEEFKARHPGAVFEIAAEGSATGLAAIIDGTADIGMSSREATATEISAAAAKGVALTSHAVAFDGMAVIVNAANPLANLRKRQVEQIFAGDVTDWSMFGSEPGPISIYTRNTSSGTYADFKDLAMSRRDYAVSSQKMAGNEQIAAEVGQNRNGIGYVGLAYVHAPGVKIVSIDRHLPTQEDVHAGGYPLARPTFFYTVATPGPVVTDFIAFVLSPDGQAIAREVGFVAVK